MAVYCYLVCCLLALTCGIAVGNENCTQSVNMYNAVVNCSVYENVPDGTLIFDASSFFDDSNSYELIGSDNVGAFARHFSYPQGTSSMFVLRSRGLFDREQMFSALTDPSETGNMVTWSVALVGVRFYILHIHVLDVNDNVPMFPQDNITETVVEALNPSNPTSRISRYLPNAIDRDEQHNAIQEYTLIDDYDGLFELIEGGNNIWRLTSTQGLDREERDNYTFQVVARDGGNQTGVLNILWIVEDINDNSPQFIGSHTFILPHNLEPLSFVGNVTAIDADAGHNGLITFSIIDSTLDLFVIDKDTGVLHTTSSYNSTMLGNARKLSVTIKAKDNGVPSLSSTAVFTVTILLPPPHCIMVGTTIDCSVHENIPIGTLIFNASSFFNDDNSFELIGSDNVGAFARHFSYPQGPSSMFVLQSRGGFDREQMFSALTDPSETGNMLTWSVALVGVRFYILHIHVLDVNDNVPMFPQDNITETVVEALNPSNPTSQISRYLPNAIDRDEQHNAIQEYTLIDDYDGLFELIEGSNNIWRLTSTQGLDREERDNYTFQVVVRDGGNQTGTLHITLIVEDINDNSPQFIGSHTFTLPHNLEPLSFVGNVTAIDADAGHNGLITFSIIDSTLDLFAIDKDTGVLRTTSSYNSTMLGNTRKLLVTIKAKDNGVPSLNSTAVFTVAIRQQPFPN